MQIISPLAKSTRSPISRSGPRWKARARNRKVLCAILRIREQQCVTGMINAKHLEMVLHQLVSAPERPEVLHALLHFEAFVRFLKRNPEWVAEQLR